MSNYEELDKKELQKLRKDKDFVKAEKIFNRIKRRTLKALKN